MNGDCMWCGKPVAPHEAAYAITGWEVPRKAGGQNHVIDRKRTGPVAHELCLDRALRGFPPEPLFPTSDR